MKKINLILFLTLIFNVKANSQSISLTDGGTTLYSLPPTFSNGAFGTMSGFASGTYFYKITRSGAFTTNNLIFGLNGNNWVANSFAPVLSGANNFSISGTLPVGVGCGQNETVKMEIKNISGGPAFTIMFYITKTSQTIGGSVALCASSSNTYSVVSPVVLTGTYTWTTSTTGWLINGLPSPVSTITNSVTLTAPATLGTTNLAVSNSSMCQPLSYSVSSAPLAIPTFSSANKVSDCTGVEVRWKVLAVPYATSYTWSTTSPSVILTPDSPGGLGCIITGTTLGTKTIKVKANNLCGSTALRSTSFVVSNAGPCGPR
jgi:hypothetical protein